MSEGTTIPFVRRNLGDVATVKWGNTSLTKASYVTQGAVAFSASGPDGFVQEAENQGKGVVLSAIGARCGRCFWADGSWTAIKNTITITGDGSADLSFLFHYLRQPNVWPFEGGAQPFISLGSARGLLVPCPPLPEQRKIAAILSSIDEAIEATQAVIDQLQVVKKAMMAELLTRGLPGRHTRFKQTEIGEVPEGWEVVSVQDCIDRGMVVGHQDGNHGGDYPRKDVFGSNGVPFLSAKHLDDVHSVDVDAAPRLPEEHAAKLRIGFAKSGDVLLAHNATVGPVAIVPPWPGTILLGTSLTYFRTNSTKLISQYLAAFFFGDVFQEQLVRVMKQSTRNQVPITRQRQLFVILPPLDEQQAIGSAFMTVVQRIAAESDYRNTLTSTKSALSSALLTGEIRVQPDEATP